MRRLIACLACRNNGSRLYGKPLQNLDIENGITILDYIIQSIKRIGVCDDIVLAISGDDHSTVYKQIALKNNVNYIYGDEDDVLARLIEACQLVDGTDIFRLTTESPFTYFEPIKEAWTAHKKNSAHLTALDNLPDGSGFEISTLDAYRASWKLGKQHHRSELCSLYIRENKEKFKINYIDVPDNIRRSDIRLTVDYPEDLVLCRFVYDNLKSHAPLIPLDKVIKLLDKNPHYKKLVEKFVESGLSTMYL